MIRRTAPRPPRRPASGLGAVAIIVVLVALSALAAAILRMGQAEQATATRDLLSQRAMQAARAGMEWGLYQAFKGPWTSCSNASQTLDLRSDYGLYATVTCDSRSFNEGESAPVAHLGSAACGHPRELGGRYC